MLRDADGAGTLDLGSSLLGTTIDANRLDAKQIDASWGGDVVVHDAHLLFQGEYSRVGFDLVIRDDANRLTVHDYFRPGRRPNLVSEEGASLSGEVVEAMALSPHGPRYAQAGTAPAAPTIGRVETVGGTASVLRNGSAVALNVGDLVYRGDVVQTGGGSSLGITFIDGTAFSLQSGARMVLNDMVYTPGGTGNSALISLVQGSISFVAGQVAKTGDMRVDTPVATMGIRGTAVNVDISADNGTTRFSVMREPDGRVGSYVLYSKTDPNVILATVSQVDVGVIVEANGSVTNFTKSPGDLGAEQLLVQFVFQLFNAGQANPIVVTPAPAPAPPPGGPQGGGGGGSSTPPDGAAGNGSSGPASPQFPAPVSPPPTGGGTAGPPVPGLPATAAQSGGGGSTQQTSDTTGSTDTAGAGNVATGGSATTTTGEPTNSASNPTGAGTVAQGQGGGSSASAPIDQTGSTQTSTPAPFTPKIVTVAADSLVLASGSRDGVLAREGASDASIATEHVVSAHALSGNEVAVGASPTTVTGTYGTLAIQSDGSYSYLALRATALAKGETGDDAFTFTVQEADGSRTTSTITFHVEGVNDAPIATPDRLALNLSTRPVVDAQVRSAGVLANDTDPDHGETAALVVSAVHAQDAPDTSVAPGTPVTVAGRYGELTIGADGTYHYVADHAQALGAGRVGDDAFTYTITDPNGATSSASLTFSVTGVNDAPVAPDQRVTLAEDTPTRITPGASDPDGDALIYSVVTGPQHGSVTVESGSFRYAPSANYNGPDSFTYRANDGTVDSNTATVSLTVTPVNDAPVVSGPSTGTVREDSASSSTGQFAAIDPDAGATATWMVTGGTSPHPANYDYRADTLTITRSATGAAGAPVLYQDKFDGSTPTSSAAFGSGFSYTTPLVLSGGRAVFDDEHATTAAGVGTPDPFTTDSTTLRTSRSADPNDTTGLKKGGDFTVAAVFDLARPVDLRSYYGVRLTDRTVGNTDPSLDNVGDDTLELIVRKGTDGIVRVTFWDVNQAANTVTTIATSTLAPLAGDDQINMRLMHAAGSSTITAAFDYLSAGVVTHSGAFTQPGYLFGGDTATTADDELYTRATLIGTEPATADSYLTGTYGTLVVNQAGQWTYNLANSSAAVQSLGANDTRTDTFSIVATDDQGAPSTPHDVTITVRGTNDAPVARNQSITLPEDTPTVIAPAASDVDAGDRLTYTVVTGPAHGSVTIESGLFHYTPTADYNGPDSFTYHANDGTVDSNSATVSLTVTPVNDAPVARDESVTTPEDTQTFITPAARDVDGDNLTYGIVTGPQHGSVTFESGTFHYTPTADYNGADSFSYHANDGTVDSNVATVSLTITPVNDAPVANDQSDTLDEDTQTFITPAATDVDGDALTYTVVTGPQHGSVDVASGTFRYTPAADYDGPDSFTYHANDGTADSNDATVTLTVTPVNDPPVIDLDTGRDGTGTSVEYTGPVLFAPGPVSITDPDTGATIDHITLRLTSSGEPDSIDTLSLDSGTGYVIERGASDGVYVMHRQDGQPGSGADFADALSHAVFTSGDDTTDRTVTIDVTPNDGTADGALATSSVHVPSTSNGGTNQAPQVQSSSPGTLYQVGREPVEVDPAITVTDADSAVLDHAEVRVSLTDFTLVTGDLVQITGGNGFTVDSASNDLVGFTDGGVIHQSFADGTLTLTGDDASPGDFQLAFRAVTFSTADQTHTGERRVQFTANDGVSESYATDEFVKVIYDANDVFLLANTSTVTASVPVPATQIPSGLTYAFDAPAHGSVTQNAAGQPGFTYTADASYVGSDSFAYTVANADGVVFTGHITIGVHPGEGGQFGAGLASLGDVDGDGRSDSAIGAPAIGGGIVFLGSSSGGQYQVQGQGSEQVGHTVAGLGDTNQDNVGDLVAGAPGATDGAGAAYVVFGRADAANMNPIATSSLDGTSAEGFTITGANAGDHAGSAVAAAGYTNGDTVPDILVGAPDANGGAGTAYLIYGKADTDTISLAAIDGTSARAAAAAAPRAGIAIHGADGDHLGFSIAGGGDLDADGFADILVGAPGDVTTTPATATTPGAVYVIHGAAGLGNLDVTDSGSFTAPDFKITGAANGDQFGYAVASIGDVNGDGYDDLAIGAPHATVQDRAEAGLVYVVYGSATLSGVDLGQIGQGIGGFTISGAAAGDHLGSSIAFAGDVNGDGLADIIVGAPGSSNNNRVGNGAAYIVLGSTAGGNVDLAQSGPSITGDHAEGHIGTTVATTGDSAGSGLAGFTAGSPQTYDAGNNIANSGYSSSTGYPGNAFTVAGDIDANTLTGTGGNDIIGGEQGNDRISGGGGADVLNGGSGQDTFVFDFGDAAGRTVITDFHPSATTPASGERDQIEVNYPGIEIANLIANATQVNSHDTLLTIDAEHAILLKNVLKAALSADDFAILSA